MSQVSPLSDPVTLPRQKGRILVGVLLALAVLAAVASGTRWSLDPRRLAFSYLTAYMFVTSVAVGALAWLMMHHLTGAVWSVTSRRMMENLARPLPLLAALFIPIVLNLHQLYSWSNAAQPATDPESAHKAAWLNPLMFSARAAVYLACWSILAWILARNSAREDQAGDESLTRQMRATSAWGLVVLALTTSFAAFDWMMSLDSHWASTIFGVYFWVGSLVGSL